jgi:hypothetical protein
MSSSTTSGAVRRTRSTTSSPRPVPPTISMSDSSASSTANAPRTRRWSSASTTRIARPPDSAVTPCSSAAARPARVRPTPTQPVPWTALPDVAALACVPWLEPPQLHRARIGASQAQQDVDRGRLARSVGAEQGHHLAGLHTQGDVVDSEGRAPALADTVEDDAAGVGRAAGAVGWRCWDAMRKASQPHKGATSTSDHPLAVTDVMGRVGVAATRRARGQLQHSPAPNRTSTTGSGCSRRRQARSNPEA